MSIANVFIHIDGEIAEILSYTNEKFYKFVETCLGSLHARILQCQHINSIPCFLLTEAPCSMFLLDIDDPE